MTGFDPEKWASAFGVDIVATVWQPIATAPNDGEILTFGGRRTTVTLETADGDYWRSAAKRGLDTVPTHWMPLPAPPTGEVQT